MTGSRVEVDALGPLDLPADALWGIQTQRSLVALSFSGRRLGELPALVRALGRVKAAAARANVAAEVIDGPIGRAVEEAAAGLAAGEHPDALVADPLAGGGAIAVHANVNEVVANLANRALGGELGRYEPVHPSGTVAASQSTADVVHTAARLAVHEVHARLAATLGELLGGLGAAADRFGSAPTLARTCLQDGVEVEARVLLDGSMAALERARSAADAAVGSLAPPTLGATVVGTGAGASDAYRLAVVPALAEVVGRPLAPHPDPASALQHGDDLLAVSAALVRLATAAAKLARDLRLLSSGPTGGFGEVRLPAVMEGSSFFAGKVNPAVPETVVQAAIQVEGFDAVARAAGREAELHLHVYDLTAAVAVLDSLRVLDGALGLLARRAVAGLAFDRERGAVLAAGATPLRTGPESPEVTR